MTVRGAALPELAYLWEELESSAAAEGIGIAIADFGGYRTEADTLEILDYRARDYAAYAARARAAGRVPESIDDFRPIAPYGSSFHNYGAARDFKISYKPPAMTEAAAVARVGAIAERLGLVSGRRFNDPPHVQLDVTLEEAAAMWDEYSAGAGEGSSSSSSAAWALAAFGVGLLVTVRYVKGLQSWR